MADFPTPDGLAFNRGLIADPAAFARDAEAASWLYLCGEDFASMDGGMSFADVQAAVGESVNIVADPPHPFDFDVRGKASRCSTTSLDRRSSLPDRTAILGPRLHAVEVWRVGPDHRGARRG